MNKTKKSKPASPAKSKPIEREPVTLQIDRLHVAPWNPRGEITEESVADLIPTIRTKGLVQRIAVVLDWESEADDMRYIVVAGNRRLVACRAVGMKEVPCELFRCTEAEARQLTLIENLKRKDAEPIYVAQTIRTLRDEDGMTTAEIAAEIGMPESWVCRRAKLIDLAPEWREAVEEGQISVTTDLLEKVSRYTLEIQRNAYEAIRRGYDTSARLSWRDVAREFECRVTDLAAAKFDRKKCAVCPNNTACSPSLWDDLDDGAKFGRCLDPRCFALKREEMEERELKRLESDGIKVVKVADFFAVPEDAVLTPTESHRVACVYRDYTGAQAIRYAAYDPTAPKMEQKAVNVSDKERDKALKEAMKAVKEWEDDALRECVERRLDVSDDRVFAAYVFALASAYNLVGGMAFQNCDAGLRSLCEAVWNGREINRRRYIDGLVSAILDKETSPSMTLRCFEAANVVLTPEQRRLVIRGK